MTDAELEAIKLPHCRNCGGAASVRRVSNEWWYVGCECQLKRQCTREFVLESVEQWRRIHGR